MDRAELQAAAQAGDAHAALRLAEACFDDGDQSAADEWVDLRQVRRYAAALTAAVEAWVVDGAD